MFQLDARQGRSLIISTRPTLNTGSLNMQVILGMRPLLWCISPSRHLTFTARQRVIQNKHAADVNLLILLRASVCAFTLTLS